MIVTVGDLIAALQEFDPDRPIRLIDGHSDVVVERLLASDETWQANGVYIQAGETVGTLPDPIYYLV